MSKRIYFLSSTCAAFLIAAFGQTEGLMAAATGCAIKTMGNQSSIVTAADVSPDYFDPKINNFIVKYRQPSLSPSGETIRKYEVKGIEIKYEQITPHLRQITVPFENRDAVLEELLEREDIEYIEADHTLESTDFMPASFSSPKQWAHQRIKTFDAWRISEGDPDIIVAVVDSGVDFSHPDLKNNMWRNRQEVVNGRDDDGNGYIDDIHGWDFVGNDNKAYPSSNTKGDYHGTHVAGIIAGVKNDVKNVVGVSPNTKIMSLRFLNGSKQGATSNAVKAIRYAVRKGAKIINASWGSFNVNKALQEAILEAQSKGVLIVASAGNYGSNNDSKPFYPASYKMSNILSVTASSQSDAWVSGINYGGSSVDVAAPGVNILSTDANRGYQYRGGSSMAAPFASGIAALALSVNSKFRYNDLKNIISGSVDKSTKLKGRVATSGRVNAQKALSYATRYKTKGITYSACD